MSILASLLRTYDRMADRGEVAPFGYSSEQVGFVIPIEPNGSLAGAPIDLRVGEGKKRRPRLMNVPASFKRPGVTPQAFFLWDNTAFALGVTASETKNAERRFAAFQDRHRKDLANSDDEGLVALLCFLDSWTPDQFEQLGWPQDMKDQNVVFALERERLSNIYLHDRQAARDLWARLGAESEKRQATCLVTGETGPIARLHPAIKGVWGAQTAGASLVSFNLDAFASYGHEQGENAPVSEAAAFAYTTALNRFLERDSRHRLQVGDASTVFWADASNATVAQDATDMFALLVGAVDEKVDSGRIHTLVNKIRNGEPLRTLRPELADGVRFYVLGLAPNAARLSIRFFVEDDFGQIAANYLGFVEAMRIEPPPKDENPSIWRMLIETAAQRKSENVPPNLAGDWLRAVLTGTAYPLTLLSTLLMRLRADKDVNGLRVAMLKAVLVSRERTNQILPKHKGVPVSLDVQNKDPGYLLGRLFATYEFAQMQALGVGVNATIRDQYYGTASATPRAVFPLLQRKATHHLARLRKDKPGLAVSLDRRIGDIFELAEPESLFVSTLTSPRQALFAIGYYHQRNDFYRRKETAPDTTESEETSA